MRVPPVRVITVRGRVAGVGEHYERVSSALSMEYAELRVGRQLLARGLGELTVGERGQAPRRADAALQVGHGEAVVDGDDDAPREERGEVRERGVAREEHVGAGQVPEVIGHEILRRQQPIGVLVVLRKAPAHAPREPLREAALFDE